MKKIAGQIFVYNNVYILIQEGDYMPRVTYDDSLPLAKIRVKAGFSQERAAVAIDITGKTLARYEHGVSDVPMRVAEKMSALYRVPFESIRKAVNDTWLSRP